MKYYYMPNQLSMALIFLFSFFAWRFEANFLYAVFGGTWYSALMLILAFTGTPFLIWWLIGLIVWSFLWLR